MEVKKVPLWKRGMQGDFALKGGRKKAGGSAKNKKAPGG
jgi:hypothetical protein